MSGDPAGSVGLTEKGIEQARELGRRLARESIDLCVTSEFPRVRATADLILDGRSVPRLVVPELNDPRLGEFEGKYLDEYRAWAEGRSPDEAAAEAESRADVVRRYVRGFRRVLARPEQRILVVGHSLPIQSIRDAAAGRLPAPVVAQVPHDEVFRFTREDLEGAVERLERWSEAPAW